MVKILSKHVGKSKNYKNDVAHICSIAIEEQSKKMAFLPMYSIAEIRRLENKYVGKTIWSWQHGSKGTVRNITSRYCSSCNEYHTCLTVDWDDGNITYPCIDGVKINSDGELEII